MTDNIIPNATYVTLQNSVTKNLGISSIHSLRTWGNEKFHPEPVFPIRYYQPHLKITRFQKHHDVMVL